MKKICVKIDDKKLEKLKIKAIKENTTLQALIEKAVDLLLKSKLLILALVFILNGCNSGGGESQAGGSSGNGGSSSIPSWSCPKNHHTVPTLIAIGDSITFASYSYAYQLATALNMPIQNFAIPGTTLDANNQYPLSMCIEINADDIVVFEPGMNDAYQAKSLTTYKAMLEAIFDRIDATHAIGLMGTTSHIDHDYVAMTNATIDTYAQVMKDLFNTHHYDRLRMVDVNTLFDSTNQANMNDTVHPNATGHTIIMNLYLSVYQSI